MCLNLSTKIYCTKYLIRQNICTHGMYPIDSLYDSGTRILLYIYMYFRGGESLGYRNDSKLIQTVIQVQRF